MKTREEALNYGLSFPNTYMEMPFHDPNWQLVRVKGSKKAFLWTYEKDGCPASECENRSCLAGFLAKHLSLRHPGLSSEQRALEHHYFRWFDPR